MKNILLIGGSYGIGLAIAQELQNGNNIFVASRTNENLLGLNVTYIPPLERIFSISFRVEASKTSLFFISKIQIIIIVFLLFNYNTNITTNR